MGKRGSGGSSYVSFSFFSSSATLFLSREIWVCTSGSWLKLVICVDIAVCIAILSCCCGSLPPKGQPRGKLFAIEAMIFSMISSSEEIMCSCGVFSRCMTVSS